MRSTDQSFSRASVRHRPHLGGAALVLPAIVGAVIALVPVVYLAFRATERGLRPVVVEVSRPQTLTLIHRSAVLTIATTVLASLLGLLCALIVGATDIRCKRFWEVVLALPLAIPTYVVAYTWLGTFSDPAPFPGALGVLVLSCYPYVYLPVLGALKRLDPALTEVARSLGNSRHQVFRRVTIPLVRPALTSGSLLVALYVLSDFGAVSLMRYDTLTQGIYLSYVGSFDRTPAAILGLLLVSITAGVVILELRTRGATAAMVSSARTPQRSTIPASLGRMQAATQCFLVAVVAASLGIPGSALVRWTIASDTLDISALSRPLGATLIAALTGAAACTALAVPIAVLSVRRPSRATSFLESSTYLGHSLPGIVIALAMVFIGVRFLTPIYQRLPLLTIAYVALFLPLAVAATRSSIVQAPPALEEASRSLGVGPLATLRRVTLRISAPGVAAGTALVALAGIKELPATLLLRPTGFDTLATQIWTDTSVADYGRAAPAAMAMVVLGGISLAILNRANHLGGTR